MASRSQSVKLDLPGESKRVLREFLEQYDRPKNNGGPPDGRLDEDELKKYLSATGIILGTDGTKEIIKLFGGDRRGISIDDLVENLDILQVHAVKGFEILEAFKVLDMNGDGRLTVRELERILTAGSGPDRWTIGEARKYIAELQDIYDSNKKGGKKGYFSYAEFVDAYMQGDFNFDTAVRPEIEKPSINESFAMQHKETTGILKTKRKRNNSSKKP